MDGVINGAGRLVEARILHKLDNAKIAILEEKSLMDVDCFRSLGLASEFLCEIQLCTQYKAFMVNMGLKSVERPVWM